MALIGSFAKTPVERLDYDIDLGPELAGDRVVDIAWVSSAPRELIVGTGPNGLPAPSLVKGKAKVWLGGGVAGKLYTVSANVQTVSGRVMQRGFGVQMIDDSSWPRPRSAWFAPVVTVTVLVVGFGVIVFWRKRRSAAAAKAVSPNPPKLDQGTKPMALLTAGRSRKPPRSKRKASKKRSRW